MEIQAQHNTTALFAEKQLTVTSSEDEIIISTPKTLTLNGGGSYLKLNQNGIEHGSEGMMIMKVATYLVRYRGVTEECRAGIRKNQPQPDPGFPGRATAGWTFSNTCAAARTFLTLRSACENLLPHQKHQRPGVPLAG